MTASIQARLSSRDTCETPSDVIFIPSCRKQCVVTTKSGAEFTHELWRGLVSEAEFNSAVASKPEHVAATEMAS